MFNLAQSFWNLALLYATILINVLTYLCIKSCIRSVQVSPALTTDPSLNLFTDKLLRWRAWSIIPRRLITVATPTFADVLPLITSAKIMAMPGCCSPCCSGSFVGRVKVFLRVSICCRQFSVVLIRKSFIVHAAYHGCKRDPKVGGRGRGRDMAKTKTRNTEA